MDAHCKEDFEKDIYELQALGLTARTVCECVDGLIKETIQSNTKDLSTTLLNKFPHLRSAIETASGIFMNEILCSAGKHLQKLPSAVDEFFSVPLNVLLPEDVLQSRQYTEVEEQQLDKEISQLKDRAERACFMEGCLQKEAEEIQKIRSRAIEKKELHELLKCTDEVSEMPDEKINHILQSMKKLKNLEDTVFDNEKFNTKDDLTLKLRFRDL